MSKRSIRKRRHYGYFYSDIEFTVDGHTFSNLSTEMNYSPLASFEDARRELVSRLKGKPLYLEIGTVPVPTGWRDAPCRHAWTVVDQHENDDRIRTVEFCPECEGKRYGCFAKRLSPLPDDNGNLMAWGPVGEWSYSYAP